MKNLLVEKNEAIFCMLAKIGDAIASPKRLKIVSLLSQGEKTVEQLASMSNQSIAATSAHLKVLRTAGLVVSRKEGRHVYCGLAGANVVRMLMMLRQLGEELVPEIREILRDYFERPETMATLTMQEVLEEVRNQRVILLDLRDTDEYMTGHLPGAKHIPAADLARRIEELPPDTPILAYCRGPYCVASLNGVLALKEKGFQARRLTFGVPEWKAQGLPLNL